MASVFERATTGDHGRDDGLATHDVLADRGVDVQGDEDDHSPHAHAVPGVHVLALAEQRDDPAEQRVLPRTGTRAFAVERMQRLVEDVAKNLSLSGSGQTNLYQLSYTAEDPKLAARVVREAVNLFMERGIGNTARDLKKSQDFIDAQLRSYQARLVEIEKRVEQFKREHVGMLGRDGQDYYARREAARAALESTQLQLQEARQTRDTYRRQSEGTEPMLLFPQGGGARIDPELAQRIAALEKQLDALRLRYTDEHPDVVGTVRLIEELKSRKAASSVDAPAITDTSGPSAYAEQIAVSVANADARVAALETPLSPPMRPASWWRWPGLWQSGLTLQLAQNEIAELEDRIRKTKLSKEANDKAMAEAVDRIPEIEREYAALLRDHAVLKSNYDNLIATREKASISQEVEDKTTAVEFRIIDPPTVPIDPAAPNRLLLSTTVLLLGLGAGIGIAFLLSQLRPTVDSIGMLEELTGRGELITVSDHATEASQRARRRGIMSYSLVTVALVGVYTAVMTLALIR